MSERKKRRYPADRNRLHDLLDRKEAVLADLQGEVEELRRVVKEADMTAIQATAQMYNVTPEQFEEIMRRMTEDTEQILPALPADVVSGSPASEEADDPEEEEDTIDEEDA